MNYSKPDTMTKEELLAWAKMNYNHWADPATGTTNPELNQSAWYILFLWAERE